MSDDDFESMRSIAAQSNLVASKIADLNRPLVSKLRVHTATHDFAEYSMTAATSTIDVLKRQIGAFEEKLSDREAVLIMMIGGPSGVSFFPSRVWSEDPDKIAFEGTDQEGHPFLVVQHVSQLNFALRSCPLAEDQTRQPIGFVIPE